MSIDINTNTDPQPSSAQENLASALTPDEVSAVEEEAIQEVVETKKQERELAELEQSLVEEFDAESKQRFDESLDADAEIRIAGAIFFPSKILATMEPDFYKEALLEFEQSEKNDAVTLICEKYPKPIALHLYRALLGTRDTKSRFESLRDTWEATIYIIYALVLGEFRANQYPLKLTRTQREEHISVKQHKQMSIDDIYTQTLSNKLDVIEQLYDYAMLNALPLNCLRIISSDIIRRIRDLNKVRNDFAHSESRSETKTHQYLEKTVDEVIAILRLASELKGVRLVRYLHGTKEYSKHAFEVYRGQNIGADETEIDTSIIQRLSGDKILHPQNILAIYNDHMYLLAPWYIHIQADAGTSTRLCYYQRQDKKTKNFIFAVLGQGETMTRPEADFTNDSSELVSLLRLGGTTS